jgi:hypothetical protein
MDKITFNDWWDTAGSTTKPHHYDDRLNHAERMAELAWNAAIKNSAAPDLMDALDTLIHVIGLTPIAGNKQALQEAFDKACAAIAKAEGRGV